MNSSNKNAFAKKKILLVDDVRLFLEMEKTFLNRKNLTIFTATSGEDALGIHKKEHVDLILLDFHMPGMRGDEVCKRIRNDDTLKDVSVIMVTTSSKPDDVEICKDAGANDYITKPIDPKLLLTKISTLLNVPIRKNMRILIRVKVEGRNQAPFFGNTVDISLAGLLIEADRELHMGDTLEVSLVLPDNDAPLTVKGTIVRIAGAKTGKGFRYGVKFSGLDWKQNGILKTFIESKTIGLP